jgi:AGZA family xanthine/uracil permease-like MFS transporter
VVIILGQFLGSLAVAPERLPVRLQTLLQTLTVLSNGFIVTALLWGSMLAFLIDRKPRLAALCSFACAVLTLFGVIHSILPKGEVYLPWTIASHGHYTIAFAYVLLSGVFLILTDEGKE